MWKNEDYRKRMELIWESEEHKEYHSKMTKEAMWRPDVRKNYLEAMSSAKTRNNISVGVRAAYQKDDVKKRYKDALNSEPIKKKIIENTRIAMQRPEVQAKIIRKKVVQIDKVTEEVINIWPSI